MSSVVIQSIDSFSSEDTNFPASNLLAKDARKWKSKDSGEKSAYVILRLEKAFCISGVDIGNEHSAFVEVLVAKSGPSNPEFKEILLTSSFMTPIESRNSTSVNRVRCFTQKDLVEPIAREKWDLVKIICTQPFNSRVQYGIAFIKLHTTCNDTQRREKLLVPEKFQQQINSISQKPPEAPTVIKLGRFTIREESPDSDGGNTSSTNLFARWKESRTGGSPISSVETKKVTPHLSTAAAIRDASKPASLKNNPPTHVVKKPVTVTHKAKPLIFDDDDDEEEVPKLLNRNRESLLYDEEDDKPNAKLEKKLMEERSRKEREKLAKESKELRDRALAEKKEKLHDTSSSKFKDFLIDAPASSSSTQVTPSRTNKKTPSPTKTNNCKPLVSPEQKRHDSKEHHKHDDRGRERNKRSSETFGNRARDEDRSAAKKPKRQQSVDRQETGAISNKKGNVPIYKPFNKLLENVVLVISGIQNPDRANLRSQALAMGAKYKSDWDSSCTHLICAFKNTPKYNQVHGHGKIVKKEWIDRCFALRKRISWRKFALDSDDAQQSDSEPEIIDAAKKPPELDRRRASHEPEAKHRENEKSVTETEEEVLAHYDLDDVVMVEERKPESYVISGSDTEEEIERVKQKQKLKSDGNGTYDKSTEDEEQAAPGETSSTELHFFDGKIFFIDDGVGAVDSIKLKRYVELYKGTITDSANKAHYVVTRQKRPMAENFSGELVKPLWVYECHDMECLIPVQRYQL
ncbi:DNA repair protein XRCC1 [Wyeomyia smithii]|uniref:DNA repair protein XRCC1 n=1 Tax=Wyeomyia smithii TaxID=174621 RepID=UPI002467AE3C|nr:DNA repair protein XRCC1 [Wyeomyia smithii]